MAADILEFEYEGQALVSCSKCLNSFEIDFTGNDAENMTIEEAIAAALEECNWDHGCCPDCSEGGFNEDDEEEFDDDE